ncbi:hypothetical protein [uncultured Gimesia sp.]|jgi:5-(aminomethyl)-3-furanmethanol phosphate kinase|uniref:amino acid kinase family protein n=1 Tax=uncultured Gimesia sp. TaxID=1678688 RepID=UPI002607932B|nr:hypothetical protein [uncultured Gimesia sp.]
MKTAVIKIGGSLFDLPDLAARLARLRDGLENRQPLIVCGGGAAANLVRDWDQTHQLGATAAHWLAIQAMMLNEQLLCHLLPDSCIVTSQTEAAAAWKKQRIPILCCFTYLQETSSPQFADLPTSWDVTSDSIAAWVALTWPAEELILLKSVDLPENKTLSELAKAGLVDAYLPRLSDCLPTLRWCNLRSDHGPLQLATVTSGNSFQSRNAPGPA